MRSVRQLSSGPTSYTTNIETTPPPADHHLDVTDLTIEEQVAAYITGQVRGVNGGLDM
jgi:hypothetical protein